MKGKIYALLFAAALLLSFSGCGCDHQWNEATCLTPKTCALCGALEGKTADHKWIEATCISPAHCAECNTLGDPMLGHDWEPATNLVPKTCNRCGETDGDVLMLSKTCDKLLGRGESGSDIYEVVANKKEDGAQTYIEIGVIKNNTWLLEPTRDMPFLTIRYDGETDEDIFDTDVYYAGQGLFISSRHDVDKSFNEYALHVYYNVESGMSFTTKEYMYTDYVSSTFINNEKEDNILVAWLKESKEFMVINKTTMEKRMVSVPGYRGPRPNDEPDFGNISDGIFIAGKKFYDLNGNMVLDVSEYTIYNESMVCFVDGKCSMRILKDRRVPERITIDRNGNVLE